VRTGTNFSITQAPDGRQGGRDAEDAGEINEKIRKGKVVVVTAEEMVGVVAEKGAKALLTAIDVVTTGTFGPMCSSGMMMNVGHSRPRIKLGGGTVTLNKVPAYAGWPRLISTSGDCRPDDDPRKCVFPGEFRYGGGHVIEELVAGKRVLLDATAYGTDCYPRERSRPGLPSRRSMRPTCSTRATPTRTTMSR